MRFIAQLFTDVNNFMAQKNQYTNNVKYDGYKYGSEI